MTVVLCQRQTCCWNTWSICQAPGIYLANDEYGQYCELYDGASDKSLPSLAEPGDEAVSVAAKRWLAAVASVTTETWKGRRR